MKAFYLSPECEEIKVHAEISILSPPDGGGGGDDGGMEEGGEV